MSYIIAITKKTKDVTTETDPNNFVFHSDYNTFKIVKTGIKTCVLTASTDNQVFTEIHEMLFTPLVTAFAKDDAESEVFPPNSEDINWYSGKVGIFGTGVKFLSIKSDATNIIFTFNNTDTSERTIKVRYFCLEAI
jgi:hypothetical protein